MPDNDSLNKRIDRLDEHIKEKYQELWDAIYRIRDKMDLVIANRLPVWATLLISILTAALGFTINSAMSQ